MEKIRPEFNKGDKITLNTGFGDVGEFQRWEGDKAVWKYWDGSIYKTPYQEYNITLYKPPNKDVPVDKGQAVVPDEFAIIKQIWRRAYLDSEEDHVKILKEYTKFHIAQERTKAYNEAVIDCIEVMSNIIDNTTVVSPHWKGYFINQLENLKL